MKFAKRYFSKAIKSMKVENWGFVTKFMAIVAFVLGIPFMFIGGFKLTDLLIPVIASACAALIVILLPYVVTIIYNLRYYRFYSLFNRKGYSPELLDKVKNMKEKYIHNKAVYKLELANIYRNIGEFDETMKLFAELDSEDLGDRRGLYVYYYLLLALQIKNTELFDMLIHENRDLLKTDTENEKKSINGAVSHLCIRAECIKGNYEKALEMCKYQYENDIWTGVCLNILYTYVLTMNGKTEYASEIYAFAKKSIDETKYEYDFEKPVFLKKLEKALNGELTLPYTQI